MGALQSRAIYTKIRTSSGAVYRFLPLSDGADAAARILLAIECGAPLYPIAERLGERLSKILDVVTRARDGNLTRHRMAIADKLPTSPGVSANHLRHALIPVHFLEIAKLFLLPGHVDLADVEKILIMTGKASPASYFVGEMRRRLVPYGILIAAVNAGGSKTVYELREGRQMLSDLIDEARELTEGE